jgi:hypothetical protein
VPADLVWTRTPPKIDAALADVGHVDSLEANGRRFPLRTARDYGTALRRAGVLGSVDDLLTHADLVAAAQAHWHTTGGDSCLFASGMSARREEAGWRAIIIAARPNLDADAAAVAEHTAVCLADPRTEIVSMILPHVDETKGVSALVTALAGHGGWSLDEIGIEHDDCAGDVVLLGLRVDLAKGVRSEILGFGPVATFPHTRRAPFTELAIRVGLGEQRREQHRGHMADVPLNLSPESVCDLCERTRDSRKLRLPAAQNKRAKAKVTFTLTRAVWAA